MNNRFAKALITVLKTPLGLASAFILFMAFLVFYSFYKQDSTFREEQLQLELHARLHHEIDNLENAFYELEFTGQFIFDQLKTLESWDKQTLQLVLFQSRKVLEPYIVSVLIGDSVIFSQDPFQAETFDISLLQMRSTNGYSTKFYRNNFLYEKSWSAGEQGVGYTLRIFLPEHEYHKMAHFSHQTLTSQYSFVLPLMDLSTIKKTPEHQVLVENIVFSKENVDHLTLAASLTDPIFFQDNTGTWFRGFFEKNIMLGSTIIIATMESDFNAHLSQSRLRLLVSWAILILIVIWLAILYRGTFHIPLSELLKGMLKTARGQYDFELSNNQSGFYNAFAVFSTMQYGLKRAFKQKDQEINSLKNMIETRKRVEEFLRESEQKYRSFFESTMDSIFLFRADNGKMNDSNRNAHLRGGYTRNEMFQKSFFELFDLDPATLRVRRIIERLLMGENIRQELTYLTAHGKRVPMEVSLSKLSAGPVPSILAIARNISERKRAQNLLKTAKESAETASQTKDAFLANISHEIRTPLNAIIGYTEESIKREQTPEIKQYLGIVARESYHLLGLINDLLDHAKIAAGKMDLEYIAFNLDEWLENINNSYALKISEKQLGFHIDKDANIPKYVKHDPTRLRQVLTNLLTNAIKFTSKGSVSVWLELRAADAQKILVRFWVVDTGTGIPLDKQKLVFESFTQADGSTTRNYGGTGLGTTISRKLVELMNGQMGLVSVPGKGSNFWFEIWIEIPSEADVHDAVKDLEINAKVGKTKQSSESMSRNSKPVLVAEDYEVNQDLLMMQFENLGVPLIVVENGQLAVDKCQEQEFSLILMDLQMPVKGGYEASREIRKKGKNTDVPVVAMTANANKAVREKCIEVGMNEVVTKPLSEKNLESILQKYLS